MDRYKLYKYVYIHVWQWQTHWQVTSRDNIFLEPRQAVSPQNGNPHRQTLIYLHGLGGAPEGMLVLSPDGEKLLKVTFIEDWCWSVDFPIDVLPSFNYIGSGVDYLQADSELLWPWRLGASYAPGLRHLTPWVFDDHGFHGSRHCTDIRSRIPQRAPVTATLGRDFGLVEPGFEQSLMVTEEFDGLMDCTILTKPGDLRYQYADITSNQVQRGRSCGTCGNWNHMKYHKIPASCERHIRQNVLEP